MPVVWQVRKLRRVFCRDRSLALNGEVDPALAARTAADESGVFPPGANQGIMHASPVGFQAEVDRLHSLLAAGVRASLLRIHNMRGHLTLLATLPVNVVHALQFTDRGG